MSDAPEMKPPSATTVRVTPVRVTPARLVIAVCLLAPFVAMLWVGSYARTDPAFIGIPFFYWYQMAWVLISTVLTATAYKLWQRDQRDQRARATSKGGADA